MSGDLYTVAEETGRRVPQPLTRVACQPDTDGVAPAPGPDESSPRSEAPGEENTDAPRPRAFLIRPSPTSARGTVFAAAISHLEGAINGTTWAFSNITAEPECGIQNDSACIVGTVADYMKMNLTLYVDPDTHRVDLVGRVVAPRRGSNVSLTGQVSCRWDAGERVAFFAASGRFNYPLFGPDIPETDPSLMPPPPPPPPPPMPFLPPSPPSSPILLTPQPPSGGSPRARAHLFRHFLIAVSVLLCIF